MLSYYKKNNPNYDIDFNSKEEAQAAIDKYKSEIMGVATFMNRIAKEQPSG